MTTPFENIVKHARGVVQATHGEAFDFKPRKKSSPNGGWDPDGTRTELQFQASFYQMPEDVRPAGTTGGSFASRIPHVSAQLSVYYSVADCPEVKNSDHVVRIRDGSVYKIIKIEPDGVGGADMILSLA